MDYFAVIDASTFSNSYHAFWNACTPTCEHFVRRLNLQGVERFERPLAKSSAAQKQALLAEFAFALFVERSKARANGASVTSASNLEEAAWRETELRLRSFASQGLKLEPVFNLEERAEMNTLSDRLTSFFSHPKRALTLRPVFSGCGFVDASEGDVTFGSAIYEVKTVDRSLRSMDIRQVLTYAALNFASKQFHIDSIGIINPRRGLYVEVELGEVCSQISGRHSQELLALIVQAISSGDVSG